jgi:threonine dehydrogenase-like Zn-dependent dehydrogenase
MPEHGGTLVAAQLPADAVTLDELNVLGVRSSPNTYPAMISLLASGAIRTEPLTTDRYGWRT